MNSFSFKNITYSATYDNKGAHNQLKSMMERRERLVLNFGIDKSDLTDIYPQIETNTILCKTLTGVGAIYSEIKTKLSG